MKFFTGISVITVLYFQKQSQFWKKVFLKISQNSQKNTSARAFSPSNFIKKRSSDTGVFLKFPAKFLRTPLFLYLEKYCPVNYIAQRYHLLYFRFIAYFLRTLISRCTSYWQFLCKQWLVKSYPILFCLPILYHITF